MILQLCLYTLLISVIYATNISPSRHVNSRSNFHQQHKALKEDITLKKNKRAKDLIALAKGKSISLNAFDLCFCGAFATIFGDFAMFPLDTVKVYQQTSSKSIGLFKAMKEIFMKQGLSGFYSGVVPYLVGDGLSGAVKFAAFEISKKWVEERVDKKYHGISQFACAAGAFLACSVILVPGEVLKTRLQSGAIKNLFSGISSILKEEGFRGFFAGYGATLLRDVPYTMLELGLYENIKSFIRSSKNLQNLSNTDELSAAAITGAVTGYITTPLDLVKTKIMSGSSESSGILDIFRNIYSSQGMSGLFAGSVARVAWLLPFTTIYLGVYEVSKRQLLDLKSRSSSSL